jgi:hypothetical protein
MQASVGWSRFLAAVLGLLLVLPLALLLRLLHPAPPSRTALPQVTISPMLTEAEAYALHTYRQRCLRQEDCEPPLGCLPKLDGTEGVCFDSGCLTDMQCAEDGMVCRTLSTLGNGPLVRACVSPGKRQEGEACSEQRWSSRHSACAQGLVCNQGWCGRRCQQGDSSTCPEGFFCQEGLDGPSCLPTCEGRICPEGQPCLRLEGGVSVCANLRGEPCQEQACAPGESCLAGDPRQTSSGLVLWQRCARACGRGKEPCPNGLPCIEGICRSRCAPEGASACTPHEKCYLSPRATASGVCLPRSR